MAGPAADHGGAVRRRGSTDAIARIIADGLSSQLHQPVVVENISGAGGMTGANRVAKAAPDGYQFVLGNVGTHAQNQSLYKRPAYNAATDFAPVALLVDQSLVLLARKDFPATTCRSSSPTPKPTRRSCNTARPALAAQIIWPACCSIRRSASMSRMFLIAAAARRCRTCWRAGGLPVPERADRDAADRQQIGEGDCLLSKNRSASMPDLPSAHEQGLTDFDIPSWYALFLPKGTPDAIVRAASRRHGCRDGCARARSD